MRSALKRVFVAACVMASGGFLLVAPNNGCLSFMAESALVATDFCFIFDCQNGLFGGTIDPCSGIGSGNQTIEGEEADSFFRDCPTQP